LGIDASLECRSHLPRDEVLRIRNATSARGVGDRGPGLADDGDQHVGGRELLLQHVRKVIAGRDLVDVEEDVVGLELALQPVA
jgi:hypothetical protein